MINELNSSLQVTASGFSIALVDTAGCRIEAGLNLASDGSDTVTFTNAAPIAIKPAPKGFDQTALMLIGAVARSLQIAGSLESMLDISVRYSNERVAFEKKISKFQAVQHNLARLAGETAAAMTAASSAADTIAHASKFDDAVFLEATAAKFAARRPPKRAPRSPIRFTVRSATRWNISCIATPCGRWHGVTISAMRVTGRSNWAGASPPAAPMNCGRWSLRADP